ncbi:MAG TPA: S8 family serine peptidase [Chitinophagales bacterium]|nr:S8 family serine peptidase [Chitinophagales bacterium]
MKTRFAVLLCACSLIYASCQRVDENELQPSNAQRTLVEKQNPTSVPTGNPIPKAELDAKVRTLLAQKGEFRWDWVDLNFIWSAAQHGEQHIAIGYKPVGIANETVNERMAEIDIRSAEWKAVHDALVQLVLDELKTQTGAEVDPKTIVVEDDPKLPILVFKLNDRNVITKLYNLENVRYLEPLDYWFEAERSTSGCSEATEPLNTADWTAADPGCKVPWNYNNVNVVNAWNMAEGQGIQIGVIDAGLSSSQTLLNGEFNAGYSNAGRTVTTDYTFGSSAFTSCVHGTAMSALATAPRGTSGATAGVAYKSSLHFIRACEDVVLDGSAEKTGVKNALVKMGDLASVRVVSMSVGTPFASGVLYDGVAYAHGKGKMLFAAAGTSYGWTSWWGVIYPAAYSQCNAITGVKENGARCSSCHDGSAVDFTVPMERSINSNRNSLTLKGTGVTPTYIGGSSCATATAAGIAALVWSVNPNLTRTQVYTCLRNTAQFYPSLSSSKGYGNLNAAAAVTMAQGL